MCDISFIFTVHIAMQECAQSQALYKKLYLSWYVADREKVGCKSFVRIGHMAILNDRM